MDGRNHGAEQSWFQASFFEALVSCGASSNVSHPSTTDGGGSAAGAAVLHDSRKGFSGGGTLLGLSLFGLVASLYSGLRTALSQFSAIDAKIYQLARRGQSRCLDQADHTNYFKLPLDVRGLRYPSAQKRAARSRESTVYSGAEGRFIQAQQLRIIAGKAYF